MLDRYGEEQPQHFNPNDIADCHLCDDTGYRGHYVCDHIDYTAAAKRGMAKVRQALEEAQQRRKEHNP